MLRLSIALLALAATSAPLMVGAAALPDREAEYAPVSHNMCAIPTGWSKPFTHIYRLRSGATLVFVGVEHTDDPADETHKQIKDAVEWYKPTLVLIERTSSTKSAFDWYRKDLADLATQRTNAGMVSENLYAVRMALDGKAQFSGWDFSPDQDYKVLLEDKFSIEDALGAHLSACTGRSVRG